MPPSRWDAVKGSDAARYVNDAKTFEQSIFRENTIFKMFPRLRRSRRYLRLDAQLRVVAGLVVQTDTQAKYHNPCACVPRVNKFRHLVQVITLLCSVENLGPFGGALTTLGMP